MGLLFTAATIAALLVWLLSPARRRRPMEEPIEDADELAAAEREVRDLGAATQPEEGFQGDDWGPGAPRGGAGR